MPILRDLPFTLTTDVLLKHLGERGQNPALQEAAERVVQMIAELTQPTAVYEVVPVREVGETWAVVGDGLRLELGPHADLLKPARLAYVSLTTLGPAVEERVDQLFAAGEMVEGYLLDSAAVTALGLAGGALKQLVEEHATQEGWGVGRRLAPGSLVGWPLREQDKLFSLLPAAEIGVTLTKSHVMLPHKSSTGLVGIGPGYEEHTVGSVCHLCNLRATCWRRR